MFTHIVNEDRQQFIQPMYKQRCTNGNDIKDAVSLIRQANLIILSSYWRLWSAQRLPNTLKLLNLTKEQQLFIVGQVKPMSYANKSKNFRMKQIGYPTRENYRSID